MTLVMAPWLKMSLNHLLKNLGKRVLTCPSQPDCAFISHAFNNALIYVSLCFIWKDMHNNHIYNYVSVVNH